MTRVVDRPARRVRRARPATGRGRAGHARGVRARGRRRGAQQLALRPGRGDADPRGGRRGGHRRVRALAGRRVRCSARSTSSRCRWSRAGIPRLHERDSEGARCRRFSVFPGRVPDVEASPAADSRDVSLTIPARPDYLVLARLALSAVCRLTPLSPEEVADLKLAITEAANDFVDESGGHRRREPAQLLLPPGRRPAAHGPRRDRGPGGLLRAGAEPGDHRGDGRRGRLRRWPHAARQVPRPRLE